MTVEREAGRGLLLPGVDKFRGCGVEAPLGCKGQGLRMVKEEGLHSCGVAGLQGFEAGSSMDCIEEEQLD